MVAVAHATAQNGTQHTAGTQTLAAIVPTAHSGIQKGGAKLASVSWSCRIRGGLGVGSLLALGCAVKSAEVSRWEASCTLLAWAGGASGFSGEGWETDRAPACLPLAQPTLGPS